MASLGDSEEVRVERAKASFNLITDYGKAGELAKARAIFEAMASLGDSEEVRAERAEASVNLISAYGNSGDLAEAQMIFDTHSSLLNSLLSVAHSNIDRIIYPLIALAALDRAKELLRLIECLDNAEPLEPMVVGLKLYLGKNVWAAREIYEVAKDVKNRISELKEAFAEKAHTQAQSRDRKP
ncbi:MAG: hypothetical protein LBP86_04475 [Azoarcus sp.]|jgi:tetratricopeptide (TPR) repeat protein|nr:hypothetical protein [Azoarcus sp.]